MSGSVALAALFDSSGEVRTGGIRRLPFAFADERGLLLSDVPDSVEVTVYRDDELVLSPTAFAVRRERIDRPYVPVLVDPADPGLHRIVADLDGEEAEATFLVSPESNNAVVPGRPLPPVDTPTPERTLGVSPICTRTPTCSLHDITVRDALGDGRPLALLVASPGTCEVSFCPPALDLLLEAVDQHSSIRFLHAEVYEDASDTSGFARTTDAVQELGLDFEPALFLVEADGRIRSRLDHVYDWSELGETLTDLVR